MSTEHAYYKQEYVVLTNYDSNYVDICAINIINPIKPTKIHIISDNSNINFYNIFEYKLIYSNNYREEYSQLNWIKCDNIELLEDPAIVKFNENSTIIAYGVSAAKELFMKIDDLFEDGICNNGLLILCVKQIQGKSKLSGTIVFK